MPTQRAALFVALSVAIPAARTVVRTQPADALEGRRLEGEVDYRNLKLDFGNLPAGSSPIKRAQTKMTVLVTGGAGYIGSVMSLLLLEQGYPLVVVDNLSRGSITNRDALKRAGLQHFYELDLSSTSALQDIMAKHAVGLVIHFAANAFASESVDRPLLYFHNVTQNTLSVLEAMDGAEVKRLIYSSSCATYGDVGAQYIPVKETTPQLPVSPYGVAKKLSEDIISSAAKSYAAASTTREGRRPALQAAMLRYFNVVGADPRTRVGPSVHDKLRRYARVADACLDAAEGKKASMEVNGVDYLTPDGTVYRDYVHVTDLTNAHLAVLEALAAMEEGVPMASPLVYNVGAMKGNSVRELASACQAATGVRFPVIEKPRRQGDPPYIVGDARKIYAELGWRAQYTNLTQSLEHMWKWRLATRADGGGGEGGGMGGMGGSDGYRTGGGRWHRAEARQRRFERAAKNW